MGVCSIREPKVRVTSPTQYLIFKKSQYDLSMIKYLFPYCFSLRGCHQLTKVGCMPACSIFGELSRLVAMSGRSERFFFSLWKQNRPCQKKTAPPGHASTSDRQSGHVCRVSRHFFFWHFTLLLVIPSLASTKLIASLPRRQLPPCSSALYGHAGLPVTQITVENSDYFSENSSQPKKYIDQYSKVGAEVTTEELVAWRMRKKGKK
jgi:hypothetical protein